MYKQMPSRSPEGSRPASPRPVTAPSVAPPDTAAPPPGERAGALLDQVPVRAPTRHGVRPLPRQVREQMEMAFQQDFSSVRVHESSGPQLLGARAFTHGETLHFARGAYHPDSPSGRRLLGHELAHIVQQRTGQVRPMARELPFNLDDSLEASAERMGQQAAMGSPMPAQTEPATLRPAPAVPTLQPALTVEGDAAYRKQVRLQLQKLAAAGMKVRVDAQGNVSLTGNANSAGQQQKPSHVLLDRLIQHGHTTTLRPQVGNEPAQAEPSVPRGRMRAAGDFASDLLHWRQWGETQTLRNRATAANPQQGTGSVIPFDPAVPEAQRQTRVRNPRTGLLENSAAPTHVMLAHELIHSDHFARGTGAFNNAGRMYQGVYGYTSGDMPVQEQTFIEEMNTVGLASEQHPGNQFTQPHNFMGHVVPPLVGSPMYQSHAQRAVDAQAITENDIRRQFGLRKRRGY